MEFLTNPWVISIIIVSVVVGNIAALKYTANMKFGPFDKSKNHQSDLDKLNEIDKLNQAKKDKIESK